MIQLSSNSFDIDSYRFGDTVERDPIAILTALRRRTIDPLLAVAAVSWSFADGRADG